MSASRGLVCVSLQRECMMGGLRVLTPPGEPPTASVENLCIFLTRFMDSILIWECRGSALEDSQQGFPAGEAAGQPQGAQPLIPLRSGPGSTKAWRKAPQRLEHLHLASQLCF